MLYEETNEYVLYRLRCVLSRLLLFDEGKYARACRPDMSTYLITVRIYRTKIEI